MTTNPIASPVALSYAAALRGMPPRQPGDAFVYVNLGCTDAEYLTCLAASNPEGTFYGLMSDDLVKRNAELLAADYKVKNVLFVSSNPTTLLQQIKAGARPIPPAHYVTLNTGAVMPDKATAATMFDLTASLLIPGGLFNFNYRPQANAEGALKFLVREFAPEMNDAQKKTFLGELKTLGGFFMSKNHALATKLDAAIAKSAAEEFYADFAAGESKSGTFETMVALRDRGFSYAGDTTIADNYVELSVPSEAQELVLSCKGNILYEPIKDYVLNREQRSDIWCFQPQPASVDVPALFGRFAFGTTLSRDQIPAEYKAQGKLIDLKSDLYSKLIDLMCLMPITIGDFLGHPSGAGAVPSDVVGAVQILVACGFIKPMRGSIQLEDVSSVARPRLVGAFNQHLSTAKITTQEVHMASAITGEPVTVSARDALVLQALDRVGLAESVGALLPELERLTQTPALAARVMDTATPTPEIAHTIINDVVARSIVSWYAYGLLKAA